MYPPSSSFHLDVESVSGILGSVSIACWVVVFSPQIIENFRRSSADGLSLVFLVVWLLGDVFNILGAALQGVLPTMLILAVYYTVADIILLIQCFYYRGFTFKEAKGTKADFQPVEEEPADHTPLLNRSDSPVRYTMGSLADRARRGSSSSFHTHLYAVDGTHLSPATPLLAPPRDAEPTATLASKYSSTAAIMLFNTSALILVCAAGVFGWWLSTRSSLHGGHHRQYSHRHGGSNHHAAPSELDFDVLGQIFGYLCAVFYLGSRVPQLLLNFHRKSTEGVSMLFFLFACVGNLTYVLSIFAYMPPCAKGDVIDGYSRRGSACHDGEWEEQYSKYILVNLSWLIGSAGTLALDAAIFVQFWIYRGMQPVAADDDREGER